MNPKVEVEQFFVSDNTCSHGNRTWDVGALFKAAKDLVDK